MKRSSYRQLRLAARKNRPTTAFAPPREFSNTRNIRVSGVSDYLGNPTHKLVRPLRIASR
jgi:hypothetical protein